MRIAPKIMLPPTNKRVGGAPTQRVIVASTKDKRNSRLSELSVPHGFIETPVFPLLRIFGNRAAMGYELSNDMAQAARLAGRLEVSDKRLKLSRRLG